MGHTSWEKSEKKKKKNENWPNNGSKEWMERSNIAIHYNLPLRVGADNYESESNHQRHQKSHEVDAKLRASHYCYVSSSSSSFLTTAKVIKTKTSSYMATQFHLFNYHLWPFSWRAMTWWLVELHQHWPNEGACIRSSSLTIFYCPFMQILFQSGKIKHPIFYFQFSIKKIQDHSRKRALKIKLIIL